MVDLPSENDWRTEALKWRSLVDASKTKIEQMTIKTKKLRQTIESAQSDTHSLVKSEEKLKELMNNLFQQCNELHQKLTNFDGDDFKLLVSHPDALSSANSLRPSLKGISLQVRFPAIMSKGKERKTLKQEKEMGMARSNSGGGSFVLEVSATKALTQQLPPLKIKSLSSLIPTASVSGPDSKESLITYKKNFAAQTISTYPTLDGTREGDPICDQFACKIYPNRSMFCIADGCSWGEKPRNAAIAACKGFMEHCSKNQNEILDLKMAGQLLVKALSAAQDEIFVGKDHFSDAGTTTFLGGFLLEVEKGSDKYLPPYEFICISIGDCKGYYLSGSEVIDITPMTRLSATDAKDPGGRLGPDSVDGNPDLRNLNIFCVPCNVGDHIVLVSDGVHDNMDPEHLGLTPAQLPAYMLNLHDIIEIRETEKYLEGTVVTPTGSPTNSSLNLVPNLLSSAPNPMTARSSSSTSVKEPNYVKQQWKTLDPNTAAKLKQRFQEDLLFHFMDGMESPQDIVDKILNFCTTVTENSRAFMKTNRGKRLPDSYKQYPGKMDHTTCMVVRVGPIASEDDKSPKESHKAQWQLSKKGSPNAQTFAQLVSMIEKRLKNPNEEDATPWKVAVSPSKSPNGTSTPIIGSPK